MRKCKKGWHLDDGRGYRGICSYCILNLNHPTLRRFNVLRTERRGLVREELLPDLHQEAREVSMRQRQRLEADYKQAASLLKDDLVWSQDFENIRFDLAEIIERFVKAGIYPEPMTAIVQTLIADENDLSI